MLKICKKCQKKFNADAPYRKFCCRSCANSYNTSKRQIDDNSIYKNGFNKINSYIFGLILSDGCISYDKHRNKYKLTISLIDKSVIEYIHDLWTPSKAIYEYKPNGYKKSYTVVSTNKNDIDFLMKNGIMERKSCITSLCVDNVPFEFYGDFLRGLFDGDGSVYINKTISNNKIYYYINVSFTSGSLVLINELQQFLKTKFNIHSTINKDTRRNTYYLYIRTKRGIKSLYNLMYSDGGICLERKKKIFNL